MYGPHTQCVRIGSYVWLRNVQPYESCVVLCMPKHYSTFFRDVVHHSAPETILVRDGM